jgi:hypothetical protein
MGKQTRTYRFDFRGYHNIAATASNVGGPWCKADTSSAGTPTMIGLNGGGLQLSFDNTSEIQNLCLYMGDKLPFDIDEIIRAWFIVKAHQTLDSATSFAWGLTGARNDDIDTIAQAALFRCIANNTVVVETDDGTNDNDDKATGLTLSSTAWGRYEIDFAARNTTVEPPSASTGRPSNIEFYGPNSQGSSRRVASGTRFDMSNYTSGLQFFFQIQKTADTNTDKFSILECGIEMNLPDYA